MPRKYQTLTPAEVIAIIRARGFVYDHSRGSHEYYCAEIRGRTHHVTVDKHYKQFSVERIRDMIDQSGLTREEFYGSTKRTARKINLIAPKYPVPLK